MLIFEKESAKSRRYYYTALYSSRQKRSQMDLKEITGSKVTRALRITDILSFRTLQAHRSPWCPFWTWQRFAHYGKSSLFLYNPLLGVSCGNAHEGNNVNHPLLLPAVSWPTWCLSYMALQGVHASFSRTYEDNKLCVSLTLPCVSSHGHTRLTIAFKKIQNTWSVTCISCFFIVTLMLTRINFEKA